MSTSLLRNGSVLVWISSVMCSVENTYHYISVHLLWIRITYVSVYMHND